jgi:hypothetical protein
MYTRDLDGFLKSAAGLADGLSKQVLHLKAERLDKLVNGEIIPRLGLHAALIGTCIIVFRISHSQRLVWIFGLIAGGLAALRNFAGHTTRR